MSLGRVVADLATPSLNMYNVFLLVMLIWSVQVTKGQQFDSKNSLKASLNGQQELTSASAAVIQGEYSDPKNDKSFCNFMK